MSLNSVIRTICKYTIGHLENNTDVIAWKLASGLAIANLLQLDNLDQVQLGSNQTKDIVCNFLPNYTLKLNQPVYDDINLSIGRAKIPGASFPDWNPFCGDAHNNAYQFGINEYLDLGSEELLHGWKEGTTIQPHIHIVVSAIPVGDQKVRFRLYYSMGKTANLMSAENYVDAETTILGGTPIRTHILFNFDPISGLNYTIGTAMIFQLWRIAKTAGGTELVGEPFVIQLGLHYQIDTIGSRQISLK